MRARDYYFSQPRLNFEAMTLGLALFCGLIFMPALIYVAGHFTLNPYANGGVFSLYFDFFKGLFQLRPSYWLVVAGPAVFLSLVRLFRWVLRKV